MLAPSYKTAKELGILELTREGLIKLLGMMERSELVDAKYPTVPNGFTMTRYNFYNNTLGHRECKTGCIGGWCHWLTGMHTQDLPAELTNPKGWSTHENFSVEKAAKALRTYLVTGQVKWT